MALASVKKLATPLVGGVYAAMAQTVPATEVGVEKPEA